MKMKKTGKAKEMKGTEQPKKAKGGSNKSMSSMDSDGYGSSSMTKMAQGMKKSPAGSKRRSSNMKGTK